MRAIVYHGPGQKAWEEVPDPEIIGDGDAIVRVDATTICGTDLHILKGDVPAVPKGRILGHEAVGTIEEVGADVVVNSSREDPLRVIRDLTGDLTGRLGADVSIEAVGTAATFEMAVKLVRPGG